MWILLNIKDYTVKLSINLLIYFLLYPTYLLEK